MTHLVEEGAILVSAVQVQADGYLGAAKLLHATVKSPTARLGRRVQDRAGGVAECTSMTPSPCS
jgi:hypothetical protein